MADSKKTSTPKKPAAVKTGGATKASTPKIAAAAKPAKPKKSASSGGSPRVSVQSLNRLSPTPGERYLLIEKEAYYRAEKRGFLGGHPAQDWLDAEAHIDKLLRNT